MPTATRKTPARKASASSSTARKSTQPATQVRKAPSPVKVAPGGQKPKSPWATPATAVKPPRSKATQASQASKPKKPKLIRDSFTIPKSEYEAIDALKRRAAAQGRSPKKSELLRAGLMVLAGLSDSAFALALSSVPAIKTGRPKA
ncbi:MAG: hypothetical protein FJY42_01075 [Betaproteobacteria bacterium]|nr:hypothetical protein [Betaproteobacteria bacterium]